MAGILDYLMPSAPSSDSLIASLSALLSPEQLANLQKPQPQPQQQEVPAMPMGTQQPQNQLQKVAPQQPPAQDFGSALARIGAATNGAGDLQKYDAGQQALQQNSALAALAAKQSQSNPGDALAALAAAAPGVAGPIYAQGLADKQKVAAQNPFASAMSGNGAPSKYAGLQGEELLKALPPQIASTIKAYGEYKIPFNARLSATPQGQSLLSMITQAYPDYDATNSPLRAAAVKDFGPGGKSRQNLTSIDTAINTLAQLQDANEKLGGAQYGNTIRNKVLNEQSDPGLVTYKQLAKTAADEVTKAVIGGAGGVHDRGAREAAFSENQSPEARKAAINAAITELNARLDPLASAYTTGVGKPVSSGIELLNPKTQEAYKKIMGVAPDNAQAPSVLGAAPTAPQNPIIATNAKGEKIQLIDGAWKPVK